MAIQDSPSGRRTPPPLPPSLRGAAGTPRSRPASIASCRPREAAPAKLGRRPMAVA